MHDKVSVVWSCISNKQATNEKERMAEDIVATLNGDFFLRGGGQRSYDNGSHFSVYLKCNTVLVYHVNAV